MPSLSGFVSEGASSAQFQPRSVRGRSRGTRGPSDRPRRCPWATFNAFQDGWLMDARVCADAAAVREQRGGPSAPRILLAGVLTNHVIFRYPNHCGRGSDVHAVEESALIARAQRGDRMAFAELVKRYWSRIFHWLHGVTRCAHSAEDLTQDVFVKVWQALPRYQNDHFRAWVFRIARNRLADFLRAKGSTKRPELPESVAAKDPDPLTQAIAVESQTQIDQACSMLPEAVRAAFLLWVREGMSYDEIADILDISLVTARWRVFKARRLLMKTLACQERQEP